MQSIKKTFLSIVIFLLISSTSAYAKTQIQWWHAFGGRLGELLDEQVKKFNASQNDYEVVHTRKGNYSETLNAGIAAFRAKQQPHVLMVFEVGTATMMAASLTKSSKSASRAMSRMLGRSKRKRLQRSRIIRARDTLPRRAASTDTRCSGNFTVNLVARCLPHRWKSASVVRLWRGHQ